MDTKTPKISLIIPVYRVEKYLDRCLASVSAQTYPNFETILVDDGSPDRCGAICDAYAATRENVIVIHQENQGLSAARNSGMKVATGAYYAFLDSDDFISPDYLAYLMRLIVESGAEISVGAFRVFFSQEEPKDANDEMQRLVYSREQALEAMLYGKGFGVSACGKCYRADLFSDISYPVGKNFEDLATTYRLFEKAERVAFGNKQIYYYRHTRESITEGTLKQKNFEAGLEAADAMLKEIEMHYPSVISAARYRYAQNNISFLKNILWNSKENRAYFKILKKRVAPIKRSVLKDPNADNLIKLKLFVMTFGYYSTNLFMRCIVWAKQFI